MLRWLTEIIAAASVIATALLLFHGIWTATNAAEDSFHETAPRQSDAVWRLFSPDR